MKKLIYVFVIGAMTATTGIASAGSLPRTGVNGSFHDITYLGATIGSYTQDDYQRACIFCHTPHNAQALGDQSGVQVPLWNHTISDVNLTPYAWAAPANLAITFDADPLIGPSRLCMSCHDGVTAVDYHGPDQGVGTAQGFQGQGHVLTTAGRNISNLAITHPIGFQYDEAFQLRGPEELMSSDNYFLASVDGDALAANLDTHNRGIGFHPGLKRISDTLYSGYLTCASCHDVHNSNNAINDPALSNPTYRPNYFIWSKEANSALCLSCHVK